VSLLCAWALSLSAVSALAAVPARPDNGWVQLGALPESLDSPIFAIAVSPLDPTIVLVGTGSGTLYRSTDAGNTWAAVGHGLGRGVLTIQYSPFKAGLVYAGTRGAGLWKSADGGATWAKQAGIPAGGDHHGPDQHGRDHHHHARAARWANLEQPRFGRTVLEEER